QPESPRINQAMMQILEELDEMKKESPTPEEVLGAAKGEVEEVRQAKEGSYVLQKVKCGDPSCHCMKKGTLHGPYWYLFSKKNGKTRSKYIGKNLPARAA
ncbi:MAG: hypothetical protein QUS07_00870, partial [Methanothrix sp.]|nr:hypothetical protein [Methanothrix sp.]